MKKLLMLTALAALSYRAQAQKLAAAQVPAAVQATFRARFPAVKTNTWEKENGDFEAGFKLNGATMSAVITPAGVLKETETDMAVNKLPAAVRATLARDYPTARITEAATLVSGTGATTYEAEMKQKGKSRDVVFNADGTVVK